jgi:hypothetical protein
MRSRHHPVAHGAPTQLEELQQRVDGHAETSALRRTIGSARREVNPDCLPSAAQGNGGYDDEGV